METTGHLFERRYHAVLVDAERYLLTLVRYIHLNPVRAGLVTDPATYRWSSHRDYVGAASAPWVQTASVLGMLASAADESVRAYMAWMKAGNGERWGEGSLVPNTGNPQILGDDDFVARHSAPASATSERMSLQTLLSECVTRFTLDPAAIFSESRSRTLSDARAWFSHEAATRGIATTSAIARFLGRDESAIRRLLQRRYDRERVKKSETSDPAP